jgi:hypothetical protein
MMTVLRSAETLPPLRAAEITYQPSVEVGDSSLADRGRARAEGRFAVNNDLNVPICCARTMASR